MTQWYNTGQQQPGVNGYWDNAGIWHDSAAANYKGQGGVPTGGHWADRGDGTMFWVPDGQADPGPPPAIGTGNRPTPPPSYNPPGGGQPTYTPGISFGAGVIPGQGDTYQRSWFNVGPSGQNEGLNQTYYDQPGNWGDAWAKVMQQFGGTPGGDFNKFLQGFSSTAQHDYQNTVPFDPNLHVANFLDQYAPQIKGVFGLIPSAQSHGGTGAIAGRAMY